MSQADAHYGGSLVDGARMLALFGDVATELLIRHDGDEGLFRAYDAVEFLAPVHAGDYVEATGEIVKVGSTSRAMRFEARKVIARAPTSPTAPPRCWPSRCWSAGPAAPAWCRRRSSSALAAAGRVTMGEPVIIAAAVVGAEVTREQNPAVPYTPEEIAAASVAPGGPGRRWSTCTPAGRTAAPRRRPPTSARSSTGSAGPGPTW